MEIPEVRVDKTAPEGSITAWGFFLEKLYEYHHVRQFHIPGAMGQILFFTEMVERTAKK